MIKKTQRPWDVGKILEEATVKVFKSVEKQSFCFHSLFLTKHIVCVLKVWQMCWKQYFLIKHLKSTSLEEIETCVVYIHVILVGTLFHSWHITAVSWPEGTPWSPDLLHFCPHDLINVSVRNLYHCTVTSITGSPSCSPVSVLEYWSKCIFKTLTFLV